MKLLRSPLFQQLLELLSGFMIGVPWLFWVLVLLCVTIYLMAILLRQVVGPSLGQTLRTTCGEGDAVEHDSYEEMYDGDCKLHYIYGEEFFGTVVGSMVTVFRCMIGDCTSGSGKSLVVHFSHGYGYLFDIVYCSGMIVILFGLFNVITAIFVEATMAGLKDNAMQKKYSRLYEADFVRKKISELIRKIVMIRGVSTIMDDKADLPLSYGDMVLTMDDFLDILDDSTVSEILCELDIGDNLEHADRKQLFDLFDSDGDGSITLLEMIDTLMKLRGSAQKRDMVAAWVGLQNLRDSFQSLELSIKEFIPQALDNQQEIKRAVDRKVAAGTEKNTEPRFMSTMNFGRTVN